MTAIVGCEISAKSYIQTFISKVRLLLKFTLCTHTHTHTQTPTHTHTHTHTYAPIHTHTHTDT